MAKGDAGLFPGATRAKRYVESADEPVFAAASPGARRAPELAMATVEEEQLTEELPAPEPRVEEAQVHVEPVEAPSAEVVLAPVTSSMLLDAPASTATPLATTGWRAGVRTATLGLVKPKASARELRRLEDLRIIRQATWTRAVNVAVANERGGVGKTSTALLLGGLLGSYRGGYVGVFEATQSRGMLHELSEGRPMRGVAELLAQADQVHTAGAVGGYTAPQTSHADVISSVGERGQMDGYDVLTIRSVLDRFYRITVTDTSCNRHGAAWMAAMDTADALVVPVMPRRLSLHGAARTLSAVAERDATGQRLCQHATAIITHDGGDEDKELAAKLPDELARMGFRHVVDVPYDAHIRSEGELSIGSLSDESVEAWTHAAALVVDTLLDAPEESPVDTAGA